MLFFYRCIRRLNTKLIVDLFNNRTLHWNKIIEAADIFLWNIPRREDFSIMPFANLTLSWQCMSFSYFVLFYFLLFIILVNYRTRYKCHISINVNSFYRVDKKCGVTDTFCIHTYISRPLGNSLKIEGRRFIYIINWPLLWYCHMSNNSPTRITFSVHFILTLVWHWHSVTFFLNASFLMQFHNKTSKFLLVLSLWTIWICLFTLNICIICLI